MRSHRAETAQRAAPALYKLFSSSMTLQQFLEILKARWKLALLLFGLTLGTAVGVSLVLPSKYTASAQVLVDMKSPDPVLGLLLPGQLTPGYMATQVDIVTSQRVALNVVDALRIAENPQAIEQWREATDGEGSIRHYFSDLLVKGLDVKPSRESSVLTVAYSGRDPKFSAIVANAFAQAYVDLSVQLKVEPARQTKGFFDTQTQALRDRLESAQNRLTAYQRDKGIVSADERLDVENTRLSELSTQLVALQALAGEAGRKQALARDAASRGSSADVPEVLSSPLIQSLKSELSRVDARFEQQSAVLGSRHPDILKLQEERTSITKKIDRETAAITGSLGNSFKIQSQREGDLKAALENQRRKVLEIKQVRDELTVLQRDVDSAQRSFDAVAQRLSQTTLESQSNQSNVVVLTPASEPRKRSSPKLMLNTALGAFLGTLLGIGGALGTELRNRRVRGPLDLKLASGVQPMGTLRDAFRGGKRGVRPSRGGLLSWIRPARGARGLAAPRGELGVETQIFAPTMFGALPTESEETYASTSASASGGSPTRTPIGRILVQAGLINPPEVERILEWAREEGVRFGEAAVARKLVTSEQLERALAYQFDYAVLERGTSAVSDEVVAAYDGRNPLVADLRRLRAKIRSAQIAAPQDSPLKSIAVISSGSGDGKSFLASNLAVTFSQMGQRTLLIDADLRRGRLHQMFGLSNATGLSSMLNRSFSKGSLQRVPGLRNLTVLTRGPEAPNPSELLSRDVFDQLLDAFAKSFDIVILDTPGVAEEPDATLVAQRAGAALVMARQHVSSFDAVIDLVQSGGTQRVAVLGSVLNQA
jgi:chain length determinant protein tyrosine kinase EpsG